MLQLTLPPELTQHRDTSQYRSARGILAKVVNTDDGSYLLYLKYECITIFETALSDATLCVVPSGR